MQRMNDVIRVSLARSLRLLSEQDRLAAALPVVCGSVLAAHCEVTALDGDRAVHLKVDSPEWLPSLNGMRDILRHDLQRVAGVPITAVHFEQASVRREAFHNIPSGVQSEPEFRRQTQRTSAGHKGRFA